MKEIIGYILIIAFFIIIDLLFDNIIINSNLSDWWKFILLK